jgi:putative ABC transport system ATP-binding protein
VSRSDGWAARCDGVVKVYAHATSRVHALRGVSLSFPAGRLTAVAGPSGSGKSTLLRLLAGMDRPTSGTVRIAGLEQAGPYALRREVGYVFQRPSDNFVPYLTVEEHLALAGDAAVEGRAVLDRLGIAHTARRRPGELSGGEQQRAALAQLLLAGNPVVVADEPTAELDTASAEGLLASLRELVGGGTTFVVATHDPGVLAVADEVIRLDHGSVFVPQASAPGTPVTSPGWAGEGWTGSPSLAPPVVEVRGVAKSFREGRTMHPALRGVDLALRPGEVLGIVGRSGSGKTTLLNVLAEWERPDGGVVEWAPGTRRASPPPWEQVAVVPQRLGLLEDLTVQENIEHPGRLAGRLDDRRERVAELIEALRLDPLADRYPREASVGEQQRAAVARALVLEPAVLLADEPTAHQDVASADAVLEAIREASYRGTASLIATHNLEAASAFDRLVEIADGRIVDGQAV